MNKLIIIVLAVLLSTGIAFAKNQNGKGTSGEQGIGHGPSGNQGNDKGVGNGGGNGGGSDDGSDDAGNDGGSDDGSDDAGTVSAPGGPSGSFGGAASSNSANTGNSGYGSNWGGSDPQSGYGALKEPKCSLVNWFKNDLECP
jgi:hypothetical protein